LISKTGLQYN